MISKQDKQKIIDLAKKYDVAKILLFGSSIDSQNEEAHDIDLGVEGIIDSKFFKFYGELIFSLSKPVDLIDLKRKSLFNDIVKSEGLILYG